MSKMLEIELYLVLLDRVDLISSSWYVLDWISDTKISGWVILLLRVPNSDPIFEFCVIYWCKVPILKIIDLASPSSTSLQSFGWPGSSASTRLVRVGGRHHNEHAQPWSGFPTTPNPYYTTTNNTTPKNDVAVFFYFVDLLTSAHPPVFFDWKNQKQKKNCAKLW